MTESEQSQPVGGPRPEVKRQRILALWYSDNIAPESLLKSSAITVAHAATGSLRHDVTMSVCQWKKFPHSQHGHFSSEFAGEKKRSHATIVAQIKQTVAQATKNGEQYDAVAFCEHDVLYPANYFDRIGDALAANPDAPVISNLDYVGLNGTGWQKVRQLDDPLHQLTIRWDLFTANLACAEEGARNGAQINLEPYAMSDRSKWVRISLAPVSMPAVHVNHGKSFTGHAAVC